MNNEIKNIEKRNSDKSLNSSMSENEEEVKKRKKKAEEEKMK